MVWVLVDEEWNWEKRGLRRRRGAEAWVTLDYKKVKGHRHSASTDLREGEIKLNRKIGTFFILCRWRTDWNSIIIKLVIF